MLTVETHAPDPSGTVPSFFDRREDDWDGQIHRNFTSIEFDDDFDDDDDDDDDDFDDDDDDFDDDDD